MPATNTQPELPLLYPPSTDIVINARCLLRQEGELLVVCVAGLAVYHWTAGDRMAEAYAMVSLVQHGYADQAEVAKAFGYSRKTLWRQQEHFESGGMFALG